MDRDGYIASGRETVPGWLHRTDGLLFDAVDRAQRAAGVTGDLLEIGCYQGASAILVGDLRQPDERFIVCDIFDDPPVSPENAAERARFYQDLNRHGFEEQYLRFHDTLPEIVAGPSSSLADAGLSKTFRFIHVDGSHLYDLVRSDLLLTKELLEPGGVVVFDDIITLHTPGVTAAVWEAIARDGLVPLIQSRKLYATWGPPFDIPIPDELPCYRHRVMGHDMVHVEDTPDPTEIVYSVTDRARRARNALIDIRSWVNLSQRERRLVLVKRRVMGALRSAARAAGRVLDRFGDDREATPVEPRRDDSGAPGRASAAAGPSPRRAARDHRTGGT